MQNNIAILLATHNGSEWLEEQIISINNQMGVNVTIFINDDDSSDNTSDICELLKIKYKNIVLLPFGNKFGSASANFFHLIMTVDFKYFSYVALADQDDVWKSDKLARAISLIGKEGFYSSNVSAYYPNGKTVEIIKSQKMVQLDYLFEGGGPGCTYVFSQGCAYAVKNFLISNATILNDITYHDWLIYAFARANNYPWTIDNWSSMHYRQHSNNQIGANGSIKGIIKRVKLIKNKWFRHQVFLISGLIGNGNASFVQRCLGKGYFGNLILATHFLKLRRSKKEQLFLFFLLLMNLF